MKLKSQENTEIIIGNTKEMSYSIDDSNPVIFDILRNKMYTNKIGAICREVSSNSRDANREAGLGDVDIEIEFTKESDAYSIGDTCIVFRDRGNGISPDRMEHVFMKYAASTKRDTDAQTGGFGLGAKTPFAYTDSFIIKTVSIVDGEKWEHTYNSIIDKSGRGKMITLNEEKTTRPTGTEIIVPIVSGEDRDTFEKECFRYTMFWDNVKYINFKNTKPKIEVVLEGNGYKIVSSTSMFLSRYMGLLDGIPYPVKPSRASSGFGDSYHILLDIELDEITINANRESIQTDSQTEAYLDKKVEALEKDLESKYTQYLNEAKDYKEALLKYANINNNNFYDSSLTVIERLILESKKRFSNNRILGQYDFKVLYKGKEVNNRLGLKHHKVLKVTNPSLSIDKDTDKIIECKFEYNKVETISKSLLDLEFVLMDTGRHSTAKQLHIIKDSRAFVLIKKASNKATEEDFAEDVALLKELDLPFKVYSEIKPPKNKVVFEKKEKGEVRIPSRDVKYDSSEPLVYDAELKKITRYGAELCKEKTLFVPSTESISNRYSYNRSEAYSKSNLLQGLDDSLTIYRVSSSNYLKRVKDLGYKTVEEYYNNLNKDNLSEVRFYTELDNLFNQLDTYIVNNFPEILPKSYNKLKALHTYYKNKGIKVSGLYESDWNRLGVKKHNFNFDGFLSKAQYILDNEYPLLEGYLSSVSYNIKIKTYSKNSSLKVQRLYNNVKTYLNSK